MKMTIRCGVRPNRSKNAIKSSTSRSNPTSERLEDLNFIMYEYINDNYMGMRITSDDGNGNYTVSWNQADVTVSFDLNAPGYVYTIDGEGPYEHSSYEYIAKDIESHIYSLQEGVVEESTNINAARYNPSTLDELVNYYSQQDMMNEDDIWDEIVNKYHNEDLANDVLDAIDSEDDYYEDNYDSIYSAHYPNGEPVPDDSSDMSKYLDFMYGTDRDPDISNYSDEEKQSAVDYWFKKNDAPPKSGKGCINCSEDFEDYEDEIQQVDQEFTSENTSINSGKLPAVFNMVHFEPGTINLDFGGGRFDNVAEYLTQYDVINLVYDPYNRSKEHNREVIKTIRKAGGADTATCSNVLNVIKEPEARITVLENIKKLVKPGGTVYITVYEGSGKGNEGPTKSGYQLNRKTADYVEEIQQVFPDASRKGKLITAINASTSIQASEDSSWDDAGSFRDEVINIITSEMGVNKEVASLIYRWYDAEDAFEDFDSAEEAVNFIQSDIWDMLDACNNEKEKQLVSKAIESSCNTSSESIDSATVLSSVSIDDLKNQLHSKLFEVMTGSGFGFPEDEVDEFSGISTKYNEDGCLQVTVWAEISYEGMEELSDALDPIIKSIDPNSYFDMECPGRMMAVLDSKYIQSATAIESAEQSLVDLDDFEDFIEVTLDTRVVVDNDGDWQWASDDFSWAANPDSPSGDWFSQKHGVYLDDASGVSEKIDELLIGMIPAKPGEYHITGDAELVYNISGVQDNRYYYDNEDYDSDIYTDDAHSEWNKEKSSVKNFQFE